ncbi:MAG: hypothetical protein RBT37_05300 [Dissulfurispiraceae bacterium]|nr:hypothetical protein [Dissulfurispiraceae bacterium]
MVCFFAAIPLYLYNSNNNVRVADPASGPTQQQPYDSFPETGFDSAVPESSNNEIMPADHQPLIGNQSVDPNPAASTLDNSAELIKKGEEELNKGRFGAALKVFLEASEKNQYALLGAGLSSYMLRDYEKAVVYLETSPEADGGFLKNKFLSYAYYRTDQIAKSMTSAQKALSVKNDPELKSFLARLQKESDTYKRYIDESTSHFKVIFDGYEHGSISRVVLRHLDDAYRKISNETGYFPVGSVEVVLYTGQDFFDITQAPQWAGGLFDGRIKIPVRGAEYNDALLRRVLFHEYVHSVVWSITRRCPLWINEGLAEYFSRKYPEKVGQIIPLENLEKSFAWLQGQHVPLAYVQSYSAVSDLIDKYGMSMIVDMLRNFEKHGDIEQAFRDSFGISYTEFISSWGRR